MNIEDEAEVFRIKTGVELPEDLIALYKEKGNGGFGPAYGFLKIANENGSDELGSILSQYLSLQNPDPPCAGWNWPKQFIPIVEIGCGEYFCIDTSKKTLAVLKFDPNGFEPGEELSNYFYRVSTSFKQWLKVQRI